MMLQAARSLNLQCGVLDPDSLAPCHIATHEFSIGSLLDFDSVVEFGRDYERVTTEFEHINCDALAQLEADGTIVYPSAAAIRLIQDKGLQKQFYADHGFPTSPFRLIDDRNALTGHTDFFPAIQKLRKLGYDGKGVYKLKSSESIPNAFDAPSIIEKWVDIAMEFSVIVARNPQGEIQTYKPVELIADPDVHLLRTLISPARIDPEIATHARDIASDLASQLKIVGILAVEFMLSSNGDLLINECAPRPHNSGHHTIQAAPYSQFEQHIRAVMGLPLGKITHETNAIMINLLGKPGHSGRALYRNLDQWLASPDVFVHLYGKKTTNPFRKMGHVTILSASFDDGLKLAAEIQASLEVVSV